jgi:hypothetical protein
MSFNDELPYDEMDPCCQREIDMNRKEFQIQKQLRTVDKSFERSDLITNVFNSIPTRVHCECCKISKDYELLYELKSQMNTSTTTGIIESSQRVNNQVEDEDEFDYLLEEEPTLFEQERKLEVFRYQQQLISAQVLGLGIHREDSIQHMLELISTGQTIVCHLYDPLVLCCAHMDVVLETIARKYLGTKFRRVPLHTSQSLLHMLTLSTDVPMLLCIKNTVLEQKSFVSSFGGDVVYLNDVEKFCSNAHVLLTEMTCLPSSLVTDADLSEEVDVYCDEPGCGRRFAHEHVGKTFSVLSTSEALGANAMQKL